MRVCEEVELHIKDYKPNNKSKKGQKKREKEILKLFRDAGIKYRTNVEDLLTNLKDKKEKEKAKQWPQQGLPDFIFSCRAL